MGGGKEAAQLPVGMGRLGDKGHAEAIAPGAFCKDFGLSRIAVSGGVPNGFGNGGGNNGITVASEGFGNGYLEPREASMAGGGGGVARLQLAQVKGVIKGLPNGDVGWEGV